MEDRSSERGDSAKKSPHFLSCARRARRGKGGAVEEPGREASRVPRKTRRRATATSHSELGERLIAGVPARIMRPRLVFLSCLVALCSFGLLMVYSASSVEALKEFGDSWYYLFRQAIFMGIGLVVFTVIGSRRVIPWHLIRSGLIVLFWGVIVALLVVVLFIGAGAESWGASRWIPLGFFNLQPAEFAKPAVIMLAADILAGYYEDGSKDTPSFLLQLVICVALPAVLILAEPDLGTTLIVLATVFVMWYVCGISYRIIGLIALVAIVSVILMIVTSPYRLARISVYLDPWSDPYGDGYQATLAIMAFASGGLFGRGIGNSTMKYHYLPEAHNDYILAIIGEELGFVGTVLLVLVFLALIAAGFYIARRSPSLHGQLIAVGCSAALLIQFCINAAGILGLGPMTGKPLPFISYGGSSVLTSLVLAALIFRVSIESDVETPADRRRAGLSVIGPRGAARGGSGEVGAGGEGAAGFGRSTSGERGGLSVLEGGGRPRVAHPRGPVRRSDGPRRETGGGYRRVDLGPRAQERLRPRGSVPRVEYGRVDYTDIARAPRPRRAGDPSRGAGSGRSGRSRNDG